MKKAAFFSVTLILLAGCSSDAENTEVLTNESVEEMVVATVQIPDPAFEQALIDVSLDSDLDGEVLVSRIERITELQINDKEIEDLTGIEAFKSLVNLNVRGNNLKAVDVSQNRDLLFIWAEDNQLEVLNVSGLGGLEKIGADRNRLQQIDISSNLELEFLTVSENLLGAIDVSNNSDLTDLSVQQNPLNCILVSQNQFTSIPEDWVKDDGDSYALDCQ